MEETALLEGMAWMVLLARLEQMGLMVPTVLMARLGHPEPRVTKGIKETRAIKGIKAIPDHHQLEQRPPPNVWTVSSSSPSPDSPTDMSFTVGPIDIPEECIPACCKTLAIQTDEIHGYATGTDTYRCGSFPNLFYSKDSQDITTNPLNAVLLLDGVPVASGVTWNVTEVCRDSAGAVPPSLCVGAGNAMATTTARRIEYCGSFSIIPTSPPEDLDITVDAPTDPDTTFTLHDVEPFGTGDCNVVFRVTATWSGFSVYVDILVNFHTDYSP